MDVMEKLTDKCHRYGWLINIVVMGLMVLTIVMAILLPIFQINQLIR